MKAVGYKLEKKTLHTTTFNKYSCLALIEYAVSTQNKREYDKSWLCNFAVVVHCTVYSRKYFHPFCFTEIMRYQY